MTEYMGYSFLFTPCCLLKRTGYRNRYDAASADSDGTSGPVTRDLCGHWTSCAWY